MHTRSQPYNYHNTSLNDPYGAIDDFDFPTPVHGSLIDQGLNFDYQIFLSPRGPGPSFSTVGAQQQSSLRQTNFLDNQGQGLSLPNTAYSQQQILPFTINNRDQRQPLGSSTNSIGGGIGSTIQNVFYSDLQQNIMAASYHPVPVQSQNRRQTRSGRQSRRAAASASDTIQVGRSSSAEKDDEVLECPRASRQELRKLPLPDLNDKLLLKIAAIGLRRRLYQTSGYNNYRGKQGNATAAQPSPWAEYLESAFIEALVFHEPSARAKQTLNGGQHGRNELVAQYIFSVTGEWRSRKMVSSHLQVLKCWVDGIKKGSQKDSLALSCIIKDTSGQREWREVIQELLMVAGYYSGQQEHLRNQILNPPSKNPLPNRGPEITPMIGVMAPEAFQLTMTAGDSHIPQTLHTFTETVTHPQQQYTGTKDWYTLTEQFRELGVLQEQRSLNCDVVMVHASIGRPQFDWRTFASPRLFASGGLRCVSNHLKAGTELAALTTIYHAHSPIAFFETKCTMQTSDQGKVTAEIPICAPTYWPDFLSSQPAVVGKEAKTSHYDNDGFSDLTGGTGNYTMTQEIDTVTNGERTRVMVVHYKFGSFKPMDKAKDGEKIYKFEGETRWRQVYISDADECDNGKSLANPTLETPRQPGDTWVNNYAGYDMQTPVSAVSSETWTTPSSASDVNKDPYFSTPSSSASATELCIDPRLSDQSITTFVDSVPSDVFNTNFDTPTIHMAGFAQQHSSMITPTMTEHEQFSYPMLDANGLITYQYNPIGAPFQQQQDIIHSSPSRLQHSPAHFTGSFGQ